MQRPKDTERQKRSGYLGVSGMSNIINGSILVTKSISDIEDIRV